MRLFLITLVAFLSLQAFATSDAWEAKTRDFFKHLIEVPTVEGRGKVPELVQYIAKTFRHAGFPESDIKIMPYGETADLIIRWRSEVKQPKRAIMLMGHLDVVEAKREDWKVDPFKLLEKDGYFYGRGTSDMKEGVTATAMAVLKLRSEGFKPNRDIVLFYSGDEETNGIGADKAATEWKDLINVEYGLNADAGGGGFAKDKKCIGFSLQTSEKTYADYTFTVTNRGGHSSKPRPDNAIYQLAGALKRLEAYRFEPQLNETTRAYFEERQKEEKGALGDAMRAWLKNPSDGKAADTIEADENETGYTRTRCVATRLEGGHANNALPQLAKATVNCRILPGVTPDAIRDELEKMAADKNVVVTRLDNDPSSPASPLRKDVVDAYTEAVHAKFPSCPIIPEMSTGASDGAYFRRAGVPVYGVDGAWGVVPDDMRAHGLDERLPVNALFDDVNHWEHIVKSLTH